jgi:AcrR family transcriptional regulator
MLGPDSRTYLTWYRQVGHIADVLSFDVGVEYISSEVRVVDGALVWALYENRNHMTRKPQQTRTSSTIPQDREAKRLHLLEVAAAEFAQSGFDDASMDDIADRAGIAKGSIYNYSGKKDQLFTDCLQLFCDELHQILDQVASTSAKLPFSQEGCLNRVALISQRLTDLTQRRPHFVTLYFSTLFGAHPRGRDLVILSAREVISALEQLFLTGQSIDLVRNDMPADLIATFVFMNRLVYLRLLDSLGLQNHSRTEQAAFLFEMHWRSIKTAPES